MLQMVHATVSATVMQELDECLHLYVDDFDPDVVVLGDRDGVVDVRRNLCFCEGGAIGELQDMKRATYLSWFRLRWDEAIREGLQCKLGNARKAPDVLDHAMISWMKSYVCVLGCIDPGTTKV